MPVMDAKFSNFANGGDLVDTDIVVGLRDGVNTRFTYTGAGVLTIDGTANEIVVDNTDPANPIIGLSPTIDAQGTFTINGSTIINSIIDDDSMATATDENISTSEAIVAYIAAQVGGVDPLTTKGDLFTYSTANARLPVGVTNGMMLQVKSSETTGLAWSTATYPETTTINQILYSSAANTVAGLATANSAMLSTNASGVPSWSASATDGQILIGSTGAQPALGTITPGTGISVANSAGGITISATGGGFAVATIAGTSQAAAVNTMYIALNAGQTTLTLPGTFSVGDTVSLVGSTANTGGWIIQAAAGDTVRVNNSTTSSGGTVTSSAVAGQVIELVADVADTSWVMVDTSSVILTTA